MRILMSYWYYKDNDLDKLLGTDFEHRPDVFADSGAFTAMTRGVEITSREYGDWLKRWGHWFSAYSNLDVIGDAERTWQNQQELESLGLRPVPCFHVLEDFSWLERYVEQYQYIALGVAGKQAKKTAIMRWLVRCFKMAGESAVFHGFGLTGWQVLKSLRWYSVDSSSWGKGFRFGNVPLFDSRRGRFEGAIIGNRQSCARHAELIRELGFEPVDFSDRTRNTREANCVASARSFMKAETYLQGIHGKIGIPGRIEEEQTGIKIYLVDTQQIADIKRIVRWAK